MFCRNFMKTFPIRKYGNITAKSGSISSDIWIINESEIRTARPFVYFVVGGIMLLAFDNFHTVDEIIGHAPRPVAYTRYERNIPKEVLLPNLPIIEGFETINKMKELQKSINYDQ